MATDLRIQIDAESAKAERALERTSRSLMRMEDQIRKADLAAAQLEKELADEAEKAARKVADAKEKAGKALLGFGAATLAGLGLATKAAIDWESAWAGVTKTVDGTPEQMAALEAELRELATTLPASHREIAAVAEAAGQLGVQRDAVASFTKTMIDLGETTNLSADAAATAIAQLGNVLGIDLKNDVDNFGAALVALGNDGASTEADILAMAQRIGGAGATIGLSTQDVLGFAAALSNVGIEAEAGGSAISRVMVDIAQAAANGGEKLDVFARTAGMSAEEFARAFEEDPARAIQAFVEGLGGINAAGGNVFATLDQLGLSQIRVRDSLLRLSNSTRGVATDLDMSNRAWEDNTALIEEANKRYETTEAKIQIAKNNIVDLAIDIGGVVLPALAQFLETGTDIVRWFSDLPGPVKTVATVLGTLAGAAALAGGGFLLLAPKLRAAQEVMQTMRTTSPALAGGLSRLGSAAKTAGLAAGSLALLVTVAKQLGGAFEQNVEIPASEAMKTLLDAADGSDTAAQSIRDLAAAADFARGGGAAWTEDWDRAREFLSGFDQSLSTLVDGGNLEKAEAGAKRIGDALREQGWSTEQIAAALPLYNESLANAEVQQRLTADSIPPIDDGLQNLATQFNLTGEDAEKAAQQMLDAWSDAAEEFFSFTDAYDTALSAKEERERETAQATADATEDASDSWEDFMGDVTLTVDEYLAELERMVANQENWRANLVSIAGRVPPEMYAELVQMGPKGAEAVALLSQMTDEELKRATAAWTTTTGQGADAIVNELAAAQPDLETVAATMGAAVANKIREHMIANGGTVREAAEALGIEIKGALPSDIPVDVSLHGPSRQRVAEVLGQIRSRLPKWIPVPVVPTGDPWNVHRASGGPVFGPGTETSDSIPALLSHNEHVLSAREVRGLGGHAAVEQLRAIARGGGTGFASGGHVAASVQASGAPTTIVVRQVLDIIGGDSDMQRLIRKWTRTGELN